MMTMKFVAEVTKTHSEKDFTILEIEGNSRNFQKWISLHEQVGLQIKI